VIGGTKSEPARVHKSRLFEHQSRPDMSKTYVLHKLGAKERRRSIKRLHQRKGTDEHYAAIAASILPGNSARDGTIRVQKSMRLFISKVLNALSPRHKSACGRYIA
jgi:hypothetical protein